MLRFHLITLFPEACEAYLSASILGRARKNKKIAVKYASPRDFTEGAAARKKTGKWAHSAIDGKPYGGGPGMVMQALPVVKAAKKSLGKNKKAAIIWFSPSAPAFTNKEADKLVKFDDVVLVCGRYEGIDERAAKMLATLGTVKRYSVGEATLTGAEVPALAIVDAVTRRLPGVLGKDASVEERRIASDTVYTRPETIVWEKKKYTVPKVLKTGHHANIDAWRGKK